MLDIPALQLIHGEDEFSTSEQVAAYKATFAAHDLSGCNLHELAGGTLTLAQLRAACDILPFLAERRLVVVSGIFAQFSKKEGDLLVGLLAYLPHLPAFTHLIFVEHQAIPSKSRWLTGFSKLTSASIQTNTLPKGAALADWISKRAKNNGGVFSPAAAQALAQAVQDEPRLAVQEIDKLLAFVRWQRPVDAKDVELLTPAANQTTVFQLVDALGNRQAREAMRYLRGLLAQPTQEPMLVFAMIIRQFRLLLQARDLLDDKKGEAEIAQQLKLHPFVAQKLTAQARRSEMGQLKRAYRYLLQVDGNIKTGKDVVGELDVLVMTLCA
jgi:DNA polymerase-3 subunit delta